MIARQSRAIGLQDTSPPIQTASIDQFVDQFVGIPSEGSVLPFHQHWGIGSKAIAMGPNDGRFDHIIFGINAELEIT